jgi:branched-chain amino acid aminotransferase
MIATSVGLGVRTSDQFLFFCLVSPVGGYYDTEGTSAVAIHVNEGHVRAVRGGVGDIKVGGNYAASLLAAEEARAAGCVQTLWLDAIERKYVEEVGTMNVFFVFEDVLVTPPLTGTILAGITRDSVLRIAQHEGRRVEERAISLTEVLDGAKSGRLKEAFGSGTAVGISPVGAFVHRGERHVVQDGGSGPIALSMHRVLSAIQRGENPLFPEWRTRVDEYPRAS